MDQPGHQVDEDHRPSPAPIEVMNLSFPRCGTMSVQAALNELGYECWHSTTCLRDVAQCQRWRDAQDAKFLQKGAPFKPADWDGIFHGYTAISADPPAFGFTEDLIAAYPTAKVILVERDEDSWYKSFSDAVVDNMFRWDLRVVAFLDPQLVGPAADVQLHWPRSWWRVNSKEEMLAKARSMYREHNRAVRALTPVDRLLVFRLQDGWEPLCKFLGKEVPKTAFPVRHDRSEVKATVHFIRMRGLQVLAMYALKMLVPAMACALGWWFLRTSRGE